MSRIYYTKPSITDLEMRYAADAVATGWGERCYDYIHKFEAAFKNHLNVRHAVSTSSCTGAMHMGLSALGIGLGDEVILGDINWIASAAPITYLGAKPVLVDVLADTWCIDPARVEEAITPRTKAIVAVHLYGNLCDMNALLEIGGRHGIPVVEDAAEAIGSIYYSNRAGSLGAFGTFSFHGTKTVTTGEGGMFVTNDTSLFERVLTLSNHGRRRDQRAQFWADEIGFKYKISNVQAAIGCGQMERLKELISAKREIFGMYKQALSHLPLRMNPEYDNTTNGYWMPTIVVDDVVPFDRQKLLDDFKARDIDGRVFFWPLSKLPPFVSATKPVSNKLHMRAVNLPSYHDLEKQDILRVCDTIVSNLTAKR